jgi:hypothetical protein
MKEAERRQLSADELEKPAKTLADRFIQRWDLFGLQTNDGRYVCVHKPLNLTKVCSHLRGDVTLGAYLLNPESQARFAVLDFDAEDSWRGLLDLTRRLNRDKIPAYAEQSRRGGHLWFFFDQPVVGHDARAFAQRIQYKYHIPECEVFPKQDTLMDGPGSLVRLPFGIHRLTGRRYRFFGGNGEPLGSTVREQISALDSIRFVPRDMIKKYASELQKPSPSIRKTHPKQAREPESLISERIKAHMTAHEFISRYVELKPTSNGAVGMCPFHEDSHPSFGVNDNGNYWHCFAGCGGGSIIDFWSKWREKQGQDASFVATITELAEMFFPKPIIASVA